MALLATSQAHICDFLAYFEGVADIEANTSKELTKLGAVIQVPFRAGNQFLGEGGMQVSQQYMYSA